MEQVFNQFGVRYFVRRFLLSRFQGQHPLNDTRRGGLSLQMSRRCNGALRPDLGDTHLTQQRQVVLDVPVVADAAVRDLEQVGRGEIDRLAGTFRAGND